MDPTVEPKGVLTSASLAAHAIGQGLAQATGKLGKHGAKQVDRLSSNDGIEMERFFGSRVKYIVGARPEVAAARDWTSSRATCKRRGAVDADRARCGRRRWRAIRGAMKRGRCVGCDGGGARGGDGDGRGGPEIRQRPDDGVPERGTRLRVRASHPGPHLDDKRAGGAVAGVGSGGCAYDTARQESAKAVDAAGVTPAVTAQLAAEAARRTAEAQATMAAEKARMAQQAGM